MGLLSLDEVKEIGPVFRGKYGEKFAKRLMKSLSVDKLNDLYDRHAHLSGPDFTADILTDLGVNYSVELGGQVLTPEQAKEKLDKILPDGPFITVSNHPYGSIDGVILIDLIASVRPDFKVVVNKILSRIKALDSNFIKVIPNGDVKMSPTATSIHGMKLSLEHLRSGCPLGLFPAGAVSNLSLKHRCIEDREWQEPIIKLIKKAKVPVLPVRFFDGNSNWYYSLGLIDWRVRLLRLPGEVFNKKGKPARVGIGPLISLEEQQNIKDIKELTALYRNGVYAQHLISEK